MNNLLAAILILLTAAFPSDADVPNAAKGQWRWTGVPQFPLEGDSMIYSESHYTTNIFLGTPPKKFKVTIDTGSDLTWVDCVSDKTANMSEYDLTRSKTGSLVPCAHPLCRANCNDAQAACPYNIMYADTSGSSGHLVSDIIRFETLMENSTAGRSSAQLVFGCSTERNGHEDVQGNLGLGHSAVSIVMQLSEQGKAPRTLSHCLSGEVKGGGFLVFGRVELPQMSRTPLVLPQ
uniref:Peptidase A1 domain-containing protein n=1 Tax=Kalanchoe fedtschenkoi TaxID=63787 RepID=A0A7N0ZUK1_KALFE